MKKTGSVKSLIEQMNKEPEYIIMNSRAQVFIGLIDGGQPNFSDDLDQARVLRGQSRFEMLQRHSFLKIEQIFV